MIELKHLHKTYPGGGGVHAVNNVDLQLPERGMVAFFGRSGCGKTTLLNCIGGLDAASEGEVLFDGTPVTPAATDLRNRHIGYIFQNYNLSKTLSVYENVAVSLRLCGVSDEREIERRVMAALESVDMEKYCRRLPDALSGGQQQRVAIARAIVKNPRLILADEPTGNLDEQNTVMVMDLLREIAKEHLVLLVTHEADLVDLYCDRVIEMADGAIVSERENETTDGYAGKNSNEIFLGDLACEREELGGLSLEYFGDPAQKPTSLRLISVGGTLYIKAQTPLKLKLLDHSAEAKIHEGSYKERGARQVREMSPVLREPLQTNGKTGCMYRLKGAIQSGFRANFKQVRRGRRMLIAGLICFPLVIVMVLGAFGTVFNDIRHIDDRYDDNTVYVSSKHITYEQATAYLNSGIVDLLTPETQSYGAAYPMAETEMSFCIGRFETFSEEYGSYFYAAGFMRPYRIMGDRALFAGRATLQNDAEMIITTAYADLLLETTGVNYIKNYEDLLYTVGSYQYWASGDDKGAMIVGVVEGSEPEFYLTDYTYAQYTIKRSFHCENGYLNDAAHSTLEIEPPARGEVIVSDTALSNRTLKEGDTLQIGSLSLKIALIVPLSERVDPALFEMWAMGEYGSNIFRDLSTYSMYFHGVDITDENTWRDFHSDHNYQRTWEQDMEDLTEFYNDDYAIALRNYSREYGEFTFGAILHPEDLLTVASMLPNVQGGGDTLNGFNTFRTESYYGFHAAGDVATLIAALEANLGSGAVTTPDEMREFLSASYRSNFLVAGIAIGVIVLAMCLSLYFIMRSSLMSDIKEVGICRAIGVSRRNLLFRYLVETLLLFALTIFVGFLLASTALFAIGSMHSVMASVLYYPVWLALCTFVGLLAVSIACGLLPIWSLLRRSPAEILSKYDV